jgi:hypothetical protein
VGRGTRVGRGRRVRRRGAARRRGGRLSRVLVHFALAATLALATLTAACEPSDAGSRAASAIDVASLVSANASDVTITAPARASPARFTNLVLVDPGSDAAPWAVLVPAETAGQPSPAPVLVDRQGAGLQSVGGVYSLPAQVIAVGTRDGPSQFLDALASADQTASSFGGDVRALGERVQAAWQRDQRFVAATRAIVGQPTFLDAAYNAEAAVAAGGTHTYTNGVVLRVDPDHPAVQMIDRALLESGTPTRAEDVVAVAVRPDERALYEPGMVANLRDVVMEKQQSTVNGQPATFYVANAALQGARLEPTGARVDLQNLLQSRLRRTDADLAVQAEELSQPGAEVPPTPAGQAQAQATPTRPATQPIQPPTVVNRYSGPSFVDDFLIWMWLTNSGFYRGPSVVIANPPPSPTRPNGDYYYVPPASGTGGGAGGVGAVGIMSALS